MWLWLVQNEVFERERGVGLCQAVIELWCWVSLVVPVLLVNHSLFSCLLSRETDTDSSTPARDTFVLLVIIAILLI